MTTGYYKKLAVKDTWMKCYCRRAYKFELSKLKLVTNQKTRTYGKEEIRKWLY